MSLINKNYLFEEFKTESGGACFDFLKFRKWGYTHIKYYTPTDKTEDILKIIEDTQNVDKNDIILSVGDNPDPRGHVYDQVYAYQSDSTEELMKQLYEIEKLGIVKVKGQDNNEFSVNYYFSNLIYETNNMSVKIPIKSSTSSGEDYWSYEYLLYPNFVVNKEVLDKVKKISGREDLDLNILHLNNTESTDRDVVRLFSTSLHRFIQIEFISTCNIVKGVVNAIRNREHNTIVDNSFYEIHQKSRMTKKDSVAYSGFTYWGDTGLDFEPSFKEYLEMIGENLRDITNITLDKLKFQEFIDNHKEDVMYKPVLAYMTNLDNPFEAMEFYEYIETQRNYIRKIRFQLNMNLFDNMRNFLGYVDYYQPGLSYSTNGLPIPLIDKVIWEYGGIYEGYNKKTYKPRIKKSKVREF